ncbi:hypothetical protein [Capnocytophaga sputigena]|uniref:hypothetical protein n=1 Tax=Capnocytophaga sputigena TaxID=1019 RepID=UPI0028D7861F|nr:hypothetical protein [Capnocytophaga sputigena]
MGNKAFGAGEQQGLKKGIEMGKKIAKETLKDKTIATAAGASILGLIAGIIFKGLSK